MLTNKEVNEKCGKAPRGLSKGILETEDTTRLVHRLEFELNTTRKIPHNDLIQILYDRILQHDKNASIKAYSHLAPAEDITPPSP